MRQFVLILGLFATSAASAFVLISPNEPRLPVSHESPFAEFVWDGQAPTISDKEDFAGGVYKDLSDEDMMNVILTQAFGVWNAVEGSYVRLRFAKGSAVEDETDRVNSIVVAKSANLSTAAYAKPYFPGSSSGVDSGDDANKGNRILDCDINVNDTETSAKSLAITLVHEVGHCLGLGHSHSNYNAIMGYSRTARTMRLGADDIAGVVYLYPVVGSRASKEVISCGSLGSQGFGLAWSLLLMPFFFALMGCFLRQKRLP